MAKGKLINLSQIQDGKLLLSQLTALQESYDAYKVITQIAKEDGEGTYNVEELLGALKTIIDEQLGDGEGSVDARIQAAKEELEVLIDAINSKEMKDRVKVTGTVTPAGDVAVDEYTVNELDESLSYNLYYENNKPVRDSEGKNVTYSFATGEASGAPHERTVTKKELETEETVSVQDDKKTFRTSNINIVKDTVIVKDSSTGDVISEEEFTVNNVSGKITFKQERDENIDISYKYEVSELEFVPIANSAKIKMFPIGTYTFATLSTDYLLDNNEMNLIAYSEVIDEIVLGLSSNSELINHIIEIVGNEAVQAQLDEMTAALEASIQAAIDRIDIIDGDDETEGSFRKLIKDTAFTLDEKIDLSVSALEEAIINAQTALEESLDAAKLEINERIDEVQSGLEETIELNKIAAEKADVDRQNDILDTNKRIDEIEAVSEVMDEFIAEDEQVNFLLSGIPSEKKIVMVVNGVRYKEIDCFTVNREAKVITWTFAAEEGGFDMEEGFIVDVLYVSVAEVPEVEHVVYP